PRWKFTLVVCVLLGRHQCRSTFVLHHEHHEFRRFGLARISSDDVNIIRPFIETLTGCQSRFLSASNLHYDRAFQHINKRMCIVTLYGIRTAWRVLDCEHETLLAWDAREIFRQDLRHLGLVDHESPRCEKCE